MLVKQTALDDRDNVSWEQRKSWLRVQYNNVSFWGKGQDGLLLTKKDSGSLSSGLLSEEQPSECAGVTWPSSSHPVRTGDLGTVQMLALRLLPLL